MKTHRVIGGGGIQLHVDEAGNPGGRPILFIHGFSQCRLCWLKQMNSGLADSFRLVAMDNRGHGLSEKPEDAYGDSRLWADDIHAVMKVLQLEKPLLCGWSYAGAIICDYIRYYGEEHVGGVNFVGAVSKLGKPAMPFLGQGYLACFPQLVSNEVGESVSALQKFVRLCVYEEPKPEDFYFFLGYNTIVPPQVRAGLRARTLENDDLLSQLRKPVLITHGEEDAIVLLRMAEHNAARISHAKTSYYPGTGHTTFWEDSERFNREIREFASSL
jgi:pimeloyl-ACP methyl ester carboxylesterase